MSTAIKKPRSPHTRRAGLLTNEELHFFDFGEDSIKAPTRFDEYRRCTHYLRSRSGNDDLACGE